MIFFFLFGLALIVGLPAGLVAAAIVFVLAKKRGIAPWPWTLGSAAPLVGLAVAAIFLLLTVTSILDRLNALERRQVFS